MASTWAHSSGCPTASPLHCSNVARFVAFVAGSAEALLLVVTLLDERLLERDLFGRQIVWWAGGGCRASMCALAAVHAWSLQLRLCARLHPLSAWLIAVLWRPTRTLPSAHPICRWVAVIGVVLALSRAFVIEAGTAFDPEAALMGAPVQHAGGFQAF